MENMENKGTTQADTIHSHMSFGSYLKKVRLEKGISIEDIMDYTRISKFVIQQIEAENRAKLPEDVFLKGFLKAYAEAVGVDPYDVLERYKKALRDDSLATTAQKRDGQAYGSKPPVKAVFAVIILLVMLALAVFFGTGESPEVAPDQSAAPVETTGEIGGINQGDTISHEETVVPANGLHLEVVCVEETTLKISADGGVPEEYLMKPEDNLELNAKTMYNILINNTCGVTLFLNNNPVTVPGKCGQTATIQLP